MFSPIRVGKFLIPNRFLMSPLYLNVESDIKPQTPAYFESVAQFFEERAANGAKLIVVGGVAPSTLGRWKANSLSLTTKNTADGLRLVSTAIKQHDSVALLQAFHGGRSSMKRLRLGPSFESVKVHPFPEYSTIKIPSMLVDTVVGEYERFAVLTEEAGFNGIELSFSDGGLVHSFLSSATNCRVDEFGGSLENRMELALRILANVKNSLANPENFVISVRLCLHDLKPGGNSMEETCRIAEYLCGSGAVDLLTSSFGMHDSPVQTLASTVPQATFAKATSIVRRHLRSKGIATPVAVSHRIHSATVAQKLIDEDACDIVGIGRPLLADAQFIKKVEEGRDSVVPCIGCNHCVNRLYKNQRVACAVNPLSGLTEEKWRNAPPAKYQKNVAVVGAGAAGITCALTLAQRGHNVVLYERSNEIGGQLNLAKVVPGKADYFAILKYWTERLRESTVKVRLNTEFSQSEVMSGHQGINAVVLCGGSIMRPIKSNFIPGASECNIIVPFWKILDGSVVAGRRVVILGNGAIAFDVASYLLHDQRVARSSDAYCVEWGVNLESGTIDRHAQVDATKNNRDVIILNKTEKDADLSKGKGWSQKLWLKNHRATVMRNAMVEKIHPDGVTVSIIMPDNRIFFIAADTIVWANGMLPNITVGTWIYEWVKDGAESRGQIAQDFGIYAAGTCRDAYSGDGHGEQDLLQVVHESFEIGCKI